MSITDRADSMRLPTRVIGLAGNEEDKAWRDGGGCGANELALVSTRDSHPVEALLAGAEHHRGRGWGEGNVGGCDALIIHGEAALAGDPPRLTLRFGEPGANKEVGQGEARRQLTGGERRGWH